MIAGSRYSPQTRLMERSTSNIPGPSRSVRSETALLMVVVFGTALLVRLACFTGLIASDDLGYSGFALRIAQGTYELEPHHYAIRYGLLLPVAAFYQIGRASCRERV